MNEEQQIPSNPTVSAPVTSDTEIGKSLKGSKKSMLFKLLLGSLVLLAIFVSSEVAYYFGYSNINKGSSCPASTPAVVCPTSAPSEEFSTVPIPPEEVKTIYFDKEQQLLSLAQSFKDKTGMINAFTLNLNIGGYVSENTAEPYDKNGTHYIQKLVLANKDGTQIVIFRFTEQELNTLKAYQINTPNKQKVSLGDISKGTYVQVVEIDDFLDNTPSSNIELRVW